MEIDNKTVEGMAHLARIELDPDQVEKMKGDMTRMLDFVAKLEQVDTEGVEPLTHMSAELNVMRKDELRPHLSHQAALGLAPQKDSNYIRVPKVKD